MGCQHTLQVLKGSRSNKCRSQNWFPYGTPFDGAGGTLAHAFAPTNGRFHYDADEKWSVGAIPDSYDLETVTLHEIGHHSWVRA
ncbi:hypothetical protein SO802_026745 [Lithocarpus litseifolius]|uniref:Peptidase M10 metallopeptidase domain-containing protein n=1 Tax=Lithocarpus litseifolius TaxID=425828 RepID=A0AAW2C0E9_9ROSI